MKTKINQFSGVHFLHINSLRIIRAIRASGGKKKNKLASCILPTGVCILHVHLYPFHPDFLTFFVFVPHPLINERFLGTSLNMRAQTKICTIGSNKILFSNVN